METPVFGNPEAWNDDQLYERTWKVVASHFSRVLRESLDRYGELADRGRETAELPEILRAAQEGRVDTLLVAEDRSFWGRIDNGQATVMKEGETGAEELINRLVIESLAQAAKVFAAPGERLPAGEFAAALLRYSNPAPLVAGASGSTQAACGQQPPGRRRFRPPKSKSESSGYRAACSCSAASAAKSSRSTASGEQRGVGSRESGVGEDACALSPVTCTPVCQQPTSGRQPAPPIP